MKNIDVEFGRVSGRFMIEKILPGGERVVAADWFENLVTDAGLDGLGTQSSAALTGACGAGSGTTPPTVGDSGLQSQLGTRAELTAWAAGPATTPVDHTWVRNVYTFNVGQVVGNVAEVGTFSSTTGGTMFSRALIKDTGGNPTTVTVLADEQLVVTYELRKYPPLTDAAGTISITVDGVATNFDYVIRAANFHSNSHQNNYYWAATREFARSGFYAVAFETNTLGGTSGCPVGASARSSQDTTATYVNGSFQRDVAHSWAIAHANFATGVGSVVIGELYGSGGHGGFQISFSPKLPKNSRRTLSLPFRFSWGRHVA